MADKVITNLEQVTPAWLTSVLTKSGAITSGSVESFEVDSGEGNWSESGSLKATYSSDAKGSLPTRLFLKMVETDLGDGESFTDSEVTYYTRDYLDVEDASLLRCYDAEYSDELNRYHILLDDVSETHIEAHDKQPTLAYGLALAEGLATLHARWWGEDLLAEAGAAMHSENHIQRFVGLSDRGAQQILHHLPNELKPEWQDSLREIFAEFTQVIIKRTGDQNGFTIIHGDVGDKNVLVPRQGDRPVYIIDRQPFNWSLTTWLGTYDIAYAIVLDWDVETRRQHEIAILKHYHECLTENGVGNYSWEQLYSDYKLCVVMCVYIATEYCRDGVNKRWLNVWLSMLKRALTACDDLDCYSFWWDSSLRSE